MKAMETERLALRPYTLDDVEDLHRVIYSDPEVCRPFCGKTKTPEEVREIVAYRMMQYKMGKFGCLAVIRKADGALMGVVALHNCLTWYLVFEDQDPRYNSLEVELAYAFGREYQKQGYATEACRAVIEYAFTELRLRRIAYGVSKDNDNSWNLMMRLGFRPGRDLHPDGENSRIGILDNDRI
jgi:RimJ/RimL family protein N-acetyltransferase